MDICFDLFPRLLSFVSLIAFLSSYNQILILCGENGISPLKLKIKHLKKHYSFIKGFLIVPCIYWFIGTRDHSIKSSVLIGLLISIISIFNPHWIFTFILFFLYLSILNSSVNFHLYPWDVLLVESLFLCFILLLTKSFLVIWAFKLLLLRLMLGFGKTKYGDIKEIKNSFESIKTLLIIQPINSPIGIWLHKNIPNQIFSVLYIILFIIEIILPFLFLLPQPFSAIASVGTILLMIGINVTSNFGHFNLLTIALSTIGFASVQYIEVNWFFIFYVLLALYAFLFNTWNNFLFPYVSGKNIIHQYASAIFRLIKPFHIIDSYGVFFTKFGPEMKMIFNIKSNEEVTLYKYQHPLIQKSKIVSPHTPRIDHFSAYYFLNIYPYVNTFCEEFYLFHSNVFQRIFYNAYYKGGTYYHFDNNNSLDTKELTCEITYNDLKINSAYKSEINHISLKNELNKQTEPRFYQFKFYHLRRMSKEYKSYLDEKSNNLKTKNSLLVENENTLWNYIENNINIDNELISNSLSELTNIAFDILEKKFINHKDLEIELIIHYYINKGKTAFYKLIKTKNDFDIYLDYRIITKDIVKLHRNLNYNNFLMIQQYVSMTKRVTPNIILNINPPLIKHYYLSISELNKYSDLPSWKLKNNKDWVKTQ